MIASVKHKLKMSVEKTNKVKKLIAIAHDPKEKKRQVRKAIYKGPLYTYNRKPQSEAVFKSYNSP
jgi:hypothetical protein